MEHPRRAHTVDRLMLASSRAADYSVLWLAIGTALWLGGGQRGRRAARHGLAALVTSSAAVNGPIKLLLPRRRPAHRHSGVRRSLRSSSFPSGHTATAFAFTTAVTRELPAAGPLLLPLATLVGASRVYLRVHHLGDVLAGAAIGTAIGLRPPWSRG